MFHLVIPPPATPRKPENRRLIFSTFNKFPKERRYVEVSRNANNGETKRQKINYEANNDRNLTKLNTHCLDLYQNEV